MTLYVSGGFKDDIQDTAWCVTNQTTPQPLPTYWSNSEETDTRIWLHVHHTCFKNIYIVSPDTDVFHIGLPMHHEGKNILLEINTVGSQQKRILSLSNLKQDLMNDPDLCSLPGELLPQIFQTLYIVTGCDYTSFFSGIGKSTFMKYFFQFAEFITSGTAVPGTLADCSLQSDAFKTGFLAFLRLIGTVYYKKYSLAFTAPTPHSHFTSFAKTGISMKAQHVNWLEDI